MNLESKLFKWKKLIMVDLGHHKADAVKDFLKRIDTLNREFFVLAVDPIDYNTGFHSKFIQAAVGTKTGLVKFNLYDEPGCNSLLDMNLDSLTRDRSKEGWFCNRDITKVGEIETNCVTLKSILEELNEPIIHYLKVDLQGNDLDAIKSAEEKIKDCLFVQVETLVGETLMYEGQNLQKEVVDYMADQGFEIMEVWDHSGESCPEADIIFFNRQLYDKN